MLSTWTKGRNAEGNENVKILLHEECTRKLMKECSSNFHKDWYIYMLQNKKLGVGIASLYNLGFGIIMQQRKNGKCKNMNGMSFDWR